MSPRIHACNVSTSSIEEINLTHSSGVVKEGRDVYGQHIRTVPCGDLSIEFADCLEEFRVGVAVVAIMRLQIRVASTSGELWIHQRICDTAYISSVSHQRVLTQVSCEFADHPRSFHTFSANCLDMRKSSAKVRPNRGVTRFHPEPAFANALWLPQSRSSR
jgi:hypothetical protein